MSAKTKFCPGCEKTLDASKFEANPHYEDGKHPYCKMCSYKYRGETWEQTRKKINRKYVNGELCECKKTGRPKKVPTTSHSGSKPYHLNHVRTYPNMGYTRQVSIEEYLRQKARKDSDD